MRLKRISPWVGGLVILLLGVMAIAPKSTNAGGDDKVKNITHYNVELGVGENKTFSLVLTFLDGIQERIELNKTDVLDTAIATLSKKARAYYWYKDVHRIIVSGIEVGK